MTRPIQIRPHSVLIDAPCEIVYQKLSSFGSGRMSGDNTDTARVVSRDGNTIVAEFDTKAGPFTYTTVEEVTLDPPESITFKHLSGPLHYALERFTFHDVDGRTELVHTGEFIWKRLPLFGWLGGMLYTKPMFERVIARHFSQVKESCEARAARSHVFKRR